MKGFDFTANAGVNQGQQASGQSQTREGSFKKKADFLNTDRNSIGLRNPSAASRRGGETVEILFNEAREMFAERNQDKDKGIYNVIRLFSDDYDINYGGVVITCTLENHTAAHVLLVEATGRYPEPDQIDQRIAGMDYQYTFIVPPSYALDRRTQESVVSLTRSYLGLGAGDTVHFVDGLIVPEEFDAKSQVDTYAVESVINISESATWADVAVSVLGYSGESIPNMLTQFQGYFDAELDFNTSGKAFYNAVGMPVRQDICIRLVLRSNQKYNNSVHQNRPVEIVNTYGYLDFIRQPNPDKMNPGMMGMMGMGMGGMFYQPDFKFAAQWITTHVESPTFILTEHIEVLSNGSIAILTNQDRNWMQIFMSRNTTRRKGEINYNDPGMLGIEGGNITAEQQTASLYGQRQYGTPIDTSAKDFTAIAMNALISSFVLPNLIVSMDLDDAGPQTWATSIYRTISDNSKENKEQAVAALGRLERSVTTLVGTPFSPEMHPFIPVTDLIHSGYYMDGREARDLRQLTSYLAVAAHITATGQDPERLSQYADTIMSEVDTDRIRSCNRFEYIKEMAQGTQVVKGYHKRVTWFGPYFSAMVESLIGAGLVVKPLNDSRFGNEVYAPKGFNLSGAGVNQGSLGIVSQQDAYVNSYGGYNAYQRTW